MKYQAVVPKKIPWPGASFEYYSQNWYLAGVFFWFRDQNMIIIFCYYNNCILLHNNFNVEYNIALANLIITLLNIIIIQIFIILYNFRFLGPPQLYNSIQFNIIWCNFRVFGSKTSKNKGKYNFVCSSMIFPI